MIAQFSIKGQDSNIDRAIRNQGTIILIARFATKGHQNLIAQFATKVHQTLIAQFAIIG